MSIIAKYKFNSTLYADLIPEFNPEFTNYTVTDDPVTETDSDGNVIKTRTIESDTLPTRVIFGLHHSSNESTSREWSLISIEYLDVSGCIDLAMLCRKCHNLISVNCSDWDTSNVKSMTWLFESCNKLTSIDTRNWDTSNASGSLGAIFSGCTSLTYIDISQWDTSKSIDLPYLFAGCTSLRTMDITNMTISDSANIKYIIKTSESLNLKYIKCDIVGTINKLAPSLATREVSDPGYILCNADDISGIDTTTLSSKNWKVTTDKGIKVAEYKFDKSMYNNLVPVFNDDYSGYFCEDAVEGNIVTREIYNVGNALPTLMRFGASIDDKSPQSTRDRCQSLVSVKYCNTRELNSYTNMFRNCSKVTSIDCKDWDLSHTKSIEYMFLNCHDLVSLDVSEWDTSEITYMTATFRCCYGLTGIDCSKWDTRSVVGISYMFYDCNKLQTLDISNFDLTSVTVAVTDMFYRTSLLTDIGMAYCNQSTVEKIASNLPTNVSRNIWVGEDIDIPSLTKYDNISYKLYSKSYDIPLNSPLLQGDELVVKEGKLYHYHKMGKVVLDGSEDWTSYAVYDNTARFGTKIQGVTHRSNQGMQCDTFKVGGSGQDIENIDIHRNGDVLQITIAKSHGITGNPSTVRAWLRDHPTTVIYPLANPYYELISDDPVYVNLFSESSNITNNSAVPVKMDISNKGVSTIAMKPSTTYTVAFDKTNPDSNISINLNGTAMSTTSNEVQITTPANITNNELVMVGDGEVSNVRLLEGTLVDDEIPRESFEGLKSSFEEGRLPENLMGDYKYRFNSGIIYSGLIEVGSDIYGKDSVTIKPSTTYTVKVIDRGRLTSSIYIGNGNSSVVFLPTTRGSLVKFTTPSSAKDVVRIYAYTDTSIGLSYTTGYESNIKFMLLEGDWTHLSEEDFNHPGKYKVEYKSVGKNLVDFHNANVVDSIYNKLFAAGLSWIEVPAITGRTYTLSVGNTEAIVLDDGTTPYLALGSRSDVYSGSYTRWINHSMGFSKSVSLTATSDKIYIYLPSTAKYYEPLMDRVIDLQLEEGTTATAYEPYKEDTKVVYLNSPLLEGDTLEEIDGEVYHNHKMGKVVLDGSDDGVYYYSTDTMTNGRTDLIPFSVRAENDDSKKIDRKYLSCNTIIVRPGYRSASGECIWTYPDKTALLAGAISVNRLTTPDTQGLREWFKQNPTTVVYELANPYREKVSSSPLLLDTYANGHLNINTNISPVISSPGLVLNNKYLNANTLYSIKFLASQSSIVNISLGGALLEDVSINAGWNTVTITTPDTLIDNNLIISGEGSIYVVKVSVVATALDYDHFVGMKSTFESELVTRGDHAGMYRVSYGTYSTPIRFGKGGRID